MGMKWIAAFFGCWLPEMEYTFVRERGKQRSFSGGRFGIFV